MIILADFSERLIELMSEKDLDAVQLAKNVLVHRNSIYRYLAATKVPTLDNALKLTNYFNCSLEYLFGRTDSNYKHVTKNIPPFSERLRFLFKCFDSNEYQMTRATKISRSSSYDWLSGKRIPSIDNIAKIADFYGCTLDFVIGRES